jgi:23S rRNA (uracil1939-C5)-methyltransferase
MPKNPCQLGNSSAWSQFVTRISLDIGSLGRRGEGIGRGPEGNVFVPFALPGEKILADVDGARGTLVALQHKSLERTSPPCVYFGRCGGCSLQHFDHVAYEDWKRSLIVSALRKYGLSAPVRPLLRAHGAGRRRATFHVRRSDGQKAMIGFMAARTHELVDIDACLVIAPELRMSLPAGRALANLLIHSAPSFDLQFTAALSGIDCDIRGLPRAQELPLAACVGISRQYGLCRISVHGQPAVSHAEPFIDCGGVTVPLPPGAFLQATQAGEQALAGFVIGHLGNVRRAVDLFCGVGTFALRLARSTPVLAVDNSKSAVEALMQAYRRNQGLKPVNGVVRNLSREPMTSDELGNADLVVFDPPRQGAEAQVMELAASRCKSIIGISCDPLTFARDAATLVGGGYELADVLPVDQFQWSSHLEVAALFKRGSKRR